MSRFSAARDDITGDTWLDRLARASLDAANAKFAGASRPSFLAVEVSRDIDATVMSVISKQMQDAVARMGKHLVDPHAEVNVIREADRERARLYPRRQIGRRLEFGFDNLDVAPGLFAADAQSTAELAAVELVNVLPESASAEVEGMAAHERALLNAVKDVIRAVEDTAGVGLTVSTSGGVESAGVLTRDQAATIGAELLDGEYERQTMEVDGRLDGMRTRRRIFYLETEQRDFEGVYDPELAESVIRHVNKPVHARIEMVRLIRKAGTPGRWAYRLLSLTDRVQPPGLFD